MNPAWPKVSIRRYQESDLEALVTLFQRSVHELAAADYDAAQRAAWAPATPDWQAWSERLSGDAVFVATAGGSRLGFCKLSPAGHVDFLYVHPDHARQGIAQRLLEQAQNWLATQDSALWNGTLTANVSLTARPFFERQGFVVLHDQEVERLGCKLRNFSMFRPAPRSFAS